MNKEPLRRSKFNRLAFQQVVVEIAEPIKNRTFIFIPKIIPKAQMV
jgi:hypothetical protein